MGFEWLIRAYMVLIFAGDCWKRRELLQCQFWSIEFRIILSIFWGWSILISFCFVQVLEHCLWRGEGVGCALVVRLLGPGAGLGLRAAGHRAAPLLPWEVPNFRNLLVNILTQWAVVFGQIFEIWTKKFLKQFVSNVPLFNLEYSDSVGELGCSGKRVEGEGVDCGGLRN